MAKLSKAQMNMLIERPYRVFLPPDFPLEIDYDKADPTQKKQMDVAYKQMEDIAESVMTNTTPKLVGSGGNPAKMPPLMIGTTEIMGILENCTTKSCYKKKEPRHGF